MWDRLSLIKNRRGQSVVETALVLPIIILILLGILEFARILSAWMIVTHASREGARAASIGNTPVQVEERVKEVADTLDPSAMTVTISPLGTLSRGDMVTVTVRYDIGLMTPYMETIVGTTVAMDAKTVMRVE